MSIFTTITLLSTQFKNRMRCQLHKFLHKKEYYTRHPISYFPSIKQNNDTVCAKNYCMQLIMYIISYFICTNFWKYFVYCAFNTVLYQVILTMISLTTLYVISLYHLYSWLISLMSFYCNNKIQRRGKPPLNPLGVAAQHNKCLFA